MQWKNHAEDLLLAHYGNDSEGRSFRVLTFIQKVQLRVLRYLFEWIACCRPFREEHRGLTFEAFSWSSRRWRQWIEKCRMRAHSLHFSELNHRNYCLLTSGVSFAGMRIKCFEHQDFVGLLVLQIVPLVLLVEKNIIRFSDYMSVDII